MFHSLATYGLSLINKQETHFNSLINVIFYNNIYNIDKTIATLIVPFSDHNFLSLCISKLKINKIKSSYQKQTINSNSVKDYIENLTTTLNNCENIDTFVKNHNIMVKSVFPFKTIYINSKNKNWWLNKEVINNLRLKKHYFVLYNENKSCENKYAFNQICKKLKNSIIEAKKNYYYKMLSSNKNNPKKMWSYIKEVIPSNAPHTSYFDKIVLLNNDIIENDGKIANAFNTYFFNIVHKLFQ